MAADLTAIMTACRTEWGDVRFTLIGDSFGVGVPPFTVNRRGDRGYMARPQTDELGDPHDPHA